MNQRKRPGQKFLLWVSISIAFTQGIYGQCFDCRNAPVGTLFCDDFEEDIPLNQKYFEYNDNNGDFIRMKGVGRDQTYGMRAKWQKGEVFAGSLSKSFGLTPSSYIGKNASAPTQKFDEIYWRMDVRHQEDWSGNGPAKLSRAMCLANSNWAQGMMAHIWSGGANDWYLGMDPASGIGTDGRLKSTKYNDFNNLRWLGFKAGTTPLYHDTNAGQWYCIVAHAKLNTPGQKNGVFEFWINDTLQASSTNLDWHSSWNQDAAQLKINAVFFENYWNAGSPKEQERYFDNLLISTQPISCSCSTSSTQHEHSSNPFTIYPNPLIGDQLMIKHAESLEIQIQLHSTEGILLLDRVIRTGHSLSLENIPAGIYFYSLYHKGKIKYKGKMVKVIY